MPFNDFITEVYCFIDDNNKELLKNTVFKNRSFTPALYDSEIITIKKSWRSPRGKNNNILVHNVYIFINVNYGLNI